jgi:hypothetical protein
MDTQLIKREQEFLERCAALKVTDQESLTRANTWSSFGKEVIKDIKAWFAPHKDRAWQAHKELCKSEEAELLKVTPVVIRLDVEVKNYTQAQAELQRKAEEERRRQQAERERLEQEALRRAQEAEDQARREQAEAERKAQEAEARARDEQNAPARKKAQEEAERIRRDAELQKRESERRAQAEQDRILAEAARVESQMPVMTVVPRAPVMVGQVMRDNWTAEVYDLLLLLVEIVAGRVVIDPLNPCVQPVASYWNALSSRTKKEGVVIPGVRFKNERIVMKVGKKGA